MCNDVDRWEEQWKGEREVPILKWNVEHIATSACGATEDERENAESGKGYQDDGINDNSVDSSNPLISAEKIAQGFYGKVIILSKDQSGFHKDHPGEGEIDDLFKPAKRHDTSQPRKHPDQDQDHHHD